MSFCGLIKEISQKICILCGFVIIYKRSFELFVFGSGSKVFEVQGRNNSVGRAWNRKARSSTDASSVPCCGKGFSLKSHNFSAVCVTVHV